MSRFTSTQIGEHWERTIEAEHREHSSSRLPVAFKVPTPVQVTSKAGRGLVMGRLEQPCWVDYVAMLPGGRMVSFDAKATTKPTFAYSSIAPHQVTKLKHCAEGGGVSFVYLAHYHDDEGDLTINRYLLPYADGVIGTLRPNVPFRFGSEEVERFRLEWTWLDRVEELIKQRVI